MSLYSINPICIITQIRHKVAINKIDLRFICSLDVVVDPEISAHAATCIGTIPYARNICPKREPVCKPGFNNCCRNVACIGAIGSVHKSTRRIEVQSRECIGHARHSPWAAVGLNYNIVAPCTIWPRRSNKEGKIMTYKTERRVGRAANLIYRPSSTRTITATKT